MRDASWVVNGCARLAPALRTSEKLSIMLDFSRFWERSIPSASAHAFGRACGRACVQERLARFLRNQERCNACADACADAAATRPCAAHTRRAWQRLRLRFSISQEAATHAQRSDVSSELGGKFVQNCKLPGI